MGQALGLFPHGFISLGVGRGFFSVPEVPHLGKWAYNRAELLSTCE